MVNIEHVAVDGDQFSTLNPMDSEASHPERRLVLLRILGCGVCEAENPGPGQFSRQRGDASCSFCVARDARYGLRGIRIGEAAQPGPGRDSRRRRRVSSSDDEVGSDDAPLVPPTVVDDVECTQWESGASFSLPSRGPEFFSTRTPVSLSNRFTALEDDRPGPELHVLSEGICSTESDTESVACEPRIRRRRLSLVWDADSVSHPANERGEVVPPRREVGTSAPVDAGRGSQRSARLAVSPRQFERQEVATELDCSGTVATVIEADEDNLSDTTSVEFQNPEARRRARRRLILTSHNQPLAEEIPDSHDRRFALVREAMQRERRATNSVRQVEAAAQSVRMLAGRVGRWNGEDIPREIRRHQYLMSH